MDALPATTSVRPEGGQAMLCEGDYAGRRQSIDPLVESWSKEAVAR
jgi:hypothetical protein